MKRKEPVIRTNNELKDFTYFLKSGGVDGFILDRLSKVSAKHRELLYETLDEFQRNRNMNYTCIFPALGSNNYDRYFQGPRPANHLLYKYLFQRNEIYSLKKQIYDSLLQAQRELVPDTRLNILVEEEEEDEEIEDDQTQPEDDSVERLEE